MQSLNIFSWHWNRRIQSLRPRLESTLFVPHCNVIDFSQSLLLCCPFDFVWQNMSASAATTETRCVAALFVDDWSRDGIQIKCRRGNVIGRGLVAAVVESGWCSWIWCCSWLCCCIFVYGYFVFNECMPMVHLSMDNWFVLVSVHIVMTWHCFDGSVMFLFAIWLCNTWILTKQRLNVFSNETDS